jgi:hypothetical protein
MLNNIYLLIKKNKINFPQSNNYNKNFKIHHLILLMINKVYYYQDIWLKMKKMENMLMKKIVNKN